VKQFISKICAILYHLIGKKLPASYTSYDFFGKQIRISYGMYVRRFLGRRMLEKCGQNVNIEKGANFPRNVQLGNYSDIGYKCEVACNTRIGDNVMMGAEVVMYSRNHKFDRVDIPMREQGFQDERPITIGNNIWIGRRVIILPGVTIGDGCVIGAGAVVAKDIEPNSIAVGNPARVVKKRCISVKDV
jgi:maltose O-acetyltransferase